MKLKIYSFEWNLIFNDFDIILKIWKFNKTALYIAVEKANVEITKLLLSHDGIDVNEKYILKSKIY